MNAKRPFLVVLAASTVMSIFILGPNAARSFAAVSTAYGKVNCVAATAANEVTPPPLPSAELSPTELQPPLCPAHEVPALIGATGFAVADRAPSEVAPNGAHNGECNTELEGGCYWHVTDAIAKTVYGAQYETTVATPEVSKFEGAHSIDQFFFGGTEKSGQTTSQLTLEGGWDVDPGMRWESGEPTAPHLFLFANWKNYEHYYTETGEKRCYCEYEPKAFVPYIGAAYAPGSALTPGTMKFGAFFEKTRWWITVNGAYIGYVPNSVWNGYLAGASEAKFYGEVFDNETPTTQMGTGRFGTENGADTMGEDVVQLVEGEFPEREFEGLVKGSKAQEPKLYSLGNEINRFWGFGGPGLGHDPSPSVVTEPATEPTTSSIRLNATVDPNLGTTHYYFEWGRTTAYGSDMPAPPGENIGTGTEFEPVHQVVTGLKAGTEYHFRVVASNAEGTTYGRDHPFLTSLAPPTYSSQFGKEGTGNGQFKRPQGVAFDGSEHLWVTDHSNNRIEEFDTTGKWIATIGKAGSGERQFKEPTGIAINKAAGDMFVVDSGNHRIQELTTAGAFVRYIGTKGFTDAADIAIDASGNLWITDSVKDEVGEYSATGTYLHSYGAPGISSGQFVGAEGIAIGANGNIYVADNANKGRVQEFTPSWSEVAEVYGGEDPKEVTVEPETEDLFTDAHSSTVFTVMSPALLSVGTFSSIHGEGVRGMAFAKNGDMYVANASLNCVEIWIPA